MKIFELTLVALIVAACGPTASPAGGGGTAGEGPLAASLEVETGADAVRFLFHVTNRSTAPVTLQFPTGQRYDFVVRNGDGEEIWRWSEGQMFTQALETMTLAPGETLRYTAEWTPGDATGAFTATGMLAASNHPVEQTASFQLPGA